MEYTLLKGAILLACLDTYISEKPAKPITTYREEKHGHTLFRITNVHKGEINFTQTIEDLIVKKILLHDNLNPANND